MREIASRLLAFFRIGTPEMTISTTLPPEDEDACLIDDDEDDDEYDDWYYSDSSPVMVADQDWEDWKRAKELGTKHPGLILMKIKGYSPAKFREIEEWAEEFTPGRWKRIEWSGSCAYTVMIGFTSEIDAVHYQLRFN